MYRVRHRNLKRTAKYARSLNPTSRVIIAADNDCWHEGQEEPRGGVH